MAGEEQEFSRGVIELIRVHRLHERDFVGDLLEVRDGVAHPESALAVLFKRTRATHELRHAGGERKGAALEERVRAILSAPFHELGFVVEDVQVGRAAGHVQVDDALGLGFEVRLARGERVIVGGRGAEGVRLHRMEGDGAEAELTDAAEEGAARLQAELGFAERVHVTKGIGVGVGVGPMGSATHEELVEVHDDAADSGPGGESGDIGAFVGRAKRIGSHLEGERGVGFVLC